jgi:hypothetical protein
MEADVAADRNGVNLTRRRLTVVASLKRSVGSRTAEAVRERDLQ